MLTYKPPHERFSGADGVDFCSRLAATWGLFVRRLIWLLEEAKSHSAFGEGGRFRSSILRASSSTRF
jgi:hypothetical protein